jgi:hypothetical protein
MNELILIICLFVIFFSCRVRLSVRLITTTQFFSAPCVTRQNGRHTNDAALQSMTTKHRERQQQEEEKQTTTTRHFENTT